MNMTELEMMELARQFKDRVFELQQDNDKQQGRINKFAQEMIKLSNWSEPVFPLRPSGMPHWMPEWIVCGDDLKIETGPLGPVFHVQKVGEGWRVTTPTLKNFIAPDRESGLKVTEIDWMAWYANQDVEKVDEPTAEPKGLIDTAQALNRSQEELESLEKDINLQLEKNIEQDAKDLGLKPLHVKDNTPIDKTYNQCSGPGVNFAKMLMNSGVKILSHPEKKFFAPKAPAEIPNPAWKGDHHGGQDATGPDGRTFRVTYLYGGAYQVNTPLGECGFGSGNDNFERAVKKAEADWRDWYGNRNETKQ